MLTALAAAAAIALAALGSGAFGGLPVQDTAGGYFSATATPLAPATSAFSIWSVIYAGIVAYAVWQLTPAGRGSERQRAIRPWAAASMLLNAGWLWAAQLGWLPTTLAVMLVLLAVLCRVFALQLATAPGSRTEGVLADGTFGLYLGWICVATLANAAAVLGYALGIPPGTPDPDLPAPFDTISAATAATVVLGAAAAVGAALALRGRLAPVAAIVWGFAWIAVARLAGPLELPSVGAAAALAAVAVLAAFAVGRLRTTRGAGDAARGTTRRRPRRGRREVHA